MKYRYEPVINRSVSSELDYFARALAKSQGDPAVRGFLKYFASRNQYGDNCAIYALVKDETIGSYEFNQVLYNNRDQTVSGFDSDFFDQDVLELFPSLSIYIYTGDDEYDVNDWDTTTNTGVLAMPDTISSAYDSLLVYYPAPSPWGLITTRIHPFNEPTIPYLSVSENAILACINLDDELMVGGYEIEYHLGLPSGTTTCEDFWEALNDGVDEGIEVTSNAVDFILLPESIILNIYCSLCEPEWDGCDGGGGGTGEDECDRDSRDERDELVKYTFPDVYHLRQTCHWTRSNCIFIIDNIFAQNPSSPTVSGVRKYHRASRRNLRGDLGRYQELASGELQFVKWDPSYIADPMKYVWTYNHPRSGERITSTHGLTFAFPGGNNTTGSIALSFEYRDIPLGEDLIYYCDDANDEGTAYFTGKVKFFIKEHE